MIPLPLITLFSKPLVKIGLAVGLCVALFSSGLYIGHKWGKESLHKAVIESQRHLLNKQAKQHQVNDEAVVKYVDRIIKVKEEAQVITKEVVKYVSNDNCTLSDGVRVFHDAAASGLLPDSEQADDATPQTTQGTSR